MAKQIIIEITKTGNVSIEAKNYEGNACEKATAPFEHAFGITEEKRYKPEFYASNAESSQLRNKS